MNGLGKKLIAKKCFSEPKQLNPPKLRLSSCVILCDQCCHLPEAEENGDCSRTNDDDDDDRPHNIDHPEGQEIMLGAVDTIVLRGLAARASAVRL